MAQAAVVTELKGENSNLKSALNESEQMTLGFGKVFAGVFAGILASNFFGKIKDGLGAAFAGVLEEERSIEKLKSVVKATGGAAGFTSEQLSQMADNLERLTGIDADVIRGAEGIIATFKNVRGDTFKEATVLAADMAEVLGTDLKGAAMQVAKALNDPERGISALARAGVQFSESQQEMIKSLMETGDMAGAQKIILEELRSQFGGAAEAAGNTLSGQLEKLKRRFEGASESVIKGLLPAIDAIMPMVEGAMNAFENVGPVLGNAITWLTDVGKTIFAELQPAMEWVRDTMIERFTALQVAIETMLGVAKDVFGAFGSTVGDAMGTAWGWFQKVQDGITSLIVNGILVMQTTIEEWRTVWELAVKSAALTMVELANDAVHLFGTVIPETMLWFGRNFTNILVDVGKFQTTVFANMAANALEFVTSIKDYLSGGKFDFQFTDLLKGFKTTIEEFPTIAGRAMTDTERALQGDIDRLGSNVGSTFDRKRREFEERVAANKKALEDLTKAGEKAEEDLKDNAKPHDLPPIKEKVEKEVKVKETKETKEDRTVKEKVDRQVNERRIGGEVEALESLAERIGAAAAGTPDATLRDVQGAVDDVEDAVDGVRDAIAGLPAGIAAAMPKPAAGGAGGGGGPVPPIKPGQPPGGAAPGPVVPPKGGGKLGPDGLPLDLPAGAEEEQERQDERARRDRRIREARSKIANRPFEEVANAEPEPEPEARPGFFEEAAKEFREAVEAGAEAERRFLEPIEFEPPEFVEPVGAPANDRELAMLDQLETMVSQLGSLDRIASLLENLRESNESLRDIRDEIPKISTGLA